MKGAILIIEIKQGIGDEPTTVTLKDTSVSQNQWAGHYVLRGDAQLEFSVNNAGLESISFVPHGAT